MSESSTQQEAAAGLTRGVQQDLVARGAGFLSIVGAVAVLALLPFYPPSHHLGVAGWMLAAPLSVLSIVTGTLSLTLKKRPSMRAAYVSSFAGIAQLAFLQWLAGGGKAPYVQLILLPTLGAATSQTTRRSLMVSAAALGAAFTPALYSHIDAGTTATEFGVVAMMSAMISVVLTSTRVHRAALMDASDQAHVLAHLDPLTGLPNRRAFDESMLRAVASRDQGTSFSLLLCDVDSFKQINDTFGHDAGDRLLCSIGRALSEAVRGPDAAFRWAGDEFAILLRNSDADGAELVAARVRETVRRCCVRPDGGTVTIGVGLAELHPGMKAKELFMAADRALFQAKMQRAAPVAKVAI